MPRFAQNSWYPKKFYPYSGTGPSMFHSQAYTSSTFAEHEDALSESSEDSLHTKKAADYGRAELIREHLQSINEIGAYGNSMTVLYGDVYDDGDGEGAGDGDGDVNGDGNDVSTVLWGGEGADAGDSNGDVSTVLWDGDGDGNSDRDGDVNCHGDGTTDDYYPTPPSLLQPQTVPQPIPPKVTAISGCGRSHKYVESEPLQPLRLPRTSSLTLQYLQKLNNMFDNID